MPQWGENVNAPLEITIQQYYYVRYIEKVPTLASGIDVGPTFINFGIFFAFPTALLEST